MDHRYIVRLERPWFLSVQLRCVARTGTITKYPMSTGTQVRFGNGEVGEVGTKFVDCGFNSLKVFGGRGLGIVYKGRGISIRRQIYRVPGLSVAGEGFTGRKKIFTVIFRWIGRGPWLGLSGAGS